MKTTKVFLRNSTCKKQIKITSEKKPEIQNKNIEKWQEMLNLIIDICEAVSCLIMKIKSNDMLILLKNNNRDKFKLEDKQKDKIKLYSENVLGNDHILEISNSIKEKNQKNNLKGSNNINYYLGLPLKWPDGEFFGTLCVLDNKERKIKPAHLNLIKTIRSHIEAQLNLLIKNALLKEKTRRDYLTNLWDRGYIVRFLENEVIKTRKNNTQLSLLLGDIDNFIEINDKYGHKKGDKILQEISKIMKNQSRDIDYIGRYGGEEFIYLLPNTSLEKAYNLAEKIRKKVQAKNFIPETKEVNVTISFGVTSYKKDDNTAKIIKRANNLLEKAQKSGMNVCIKG